MFPKAFLPILANILSIFYVLFCISSNPTYTTLYFHHSNTRVLFSYKHVLVLQMFYSSRIREYTVYGVHHYTVIAFLHAMSFPPCPSFVFFPSVDEAFVVRPDNSADLQMIGAKGNMSLLYISLEGITLALQVSVVQFNRSSLILLDRLSYCSYISEF